MNMQFSEWWGELCKIYEEYYPPNKLTTKDREDWRDYYEDGYTPQEAIDDERQY